MGNTSLDDALFDDLEARKGVLDELLLDPAQMRAHRFLGERRIALRDRGRDAAVRGRIFGLTIDAMGGFPPMPPASLRCDLQHRLENCDQQGIARRRRDAAVEGGIGLLIGGGIFRVAAGFGSVEQLVVSPRVARKAARRACAGSIASRASSVSTGLLSLDSSRTRPSVPRRASVTNVPRP